MQYYKRQLEDSTRPCFSHLVSIRQTFRFSDFADIRPRVFIGGSPKSHCLRRPHSTPATSTILWDMTCFAFKVKTSGFPKRNRIHICHVVHLYTHACIQCVPSNRYTVWYNVIFDSRELHDVFKVLFLPFFYYYYFYRNMLVLFYTLIYSRVLLYWTRIYIAMYAISLPMYIMPVDIDMI